MAEKDNNKDAADYGIGVPVKKSPFFLKGLEHVDWGMKDRLSRIFNPKSGNTVMLAFDHGYIMGPTSGLERMDLTITPLIEYLDTVAQFPRDYLWMYPAVLLVLSYVVVMAAIHAYASPQKKIFSQIGLCFAVISAFLLFTDYFVQFSVVPISLMNGETEGIPLLTQYNPHGVFIALEEAGYLMMSLSFLWMAPVFADKKRLETAVRWIFIIAFVLTVISLAAVSIRYGLDRQDRFEVAVISINWLVLIINGILLSIVFKRRLATRRA